MKESTQVEPNKRQVSLLRQLDIPIEHLDYDYVKNCNNVHEVEKILCILRSGEEGHYPDLEKYVELHLKMLSPTSKLLRTETPMLTRSSLERADLQTIDQDLSSWLEQIDQGFQESQDGSNIFTTRSVDEYVNDNNTNVTQVPVRGTHLVIPVEPLQTSSNNTPDNFLKKRNPEHIKSWEYDKWAKFNVDAELTKLDLEEMRKEEELNQKQEKTINQETTVVSVTKNDGAKIRSNLTIKNSKDTQKMNEYPSTSPATTLKASSSQTLKDESKNTTSKIRQVLEPSYIEELNDDDEDLSLKLVKNLEKQKSVQEISSTPNNRIQAPMNSKAESISSVNSNTLKKDEEKQNPPQRRFKIMIEDINIG